MRRGDYASGRFWRYGKDKKEAWLQAIYNPVFDSNVKPFKVLNYASDISSEIQERTYSSQGITAELDQLASELSDVLYPPGLKCAD